MFSGEVYDSVEYEVPKIKRANNFFMCFFPFKKKRELKQMY